MKKDWKIFLLASIVPALFLPGCAKDEEPDLAGFPSSRLRIDIVDVEKPVPVLTLKSTYDQTGGLQVDGSLSHDYVIRLSRPSPGDMTLSLEPIHVNIPAEKVSLSNTKYTLPAGYVDIPVSVLFTDPDFNFAAPEKDAKTYEIGVRVTGVWGFNTFGRGVESKVIVEKETYSANISLAGTKGREVDIMRAYWEGKIIEKEPMSYDFKVYLDKPASKDVTVTFGMEGLAPAFSGDWSVTPSSVTIPAGSLSSETVTWTMKDNFLLTNDKEESHTLTLTPSFKSEDTYVSLAGKDKVGIMFDIRKSFNILEALSLNTVLANQNKLSTNGWQITGYNNSRNLFDGKANTLIFFPGLMAVTVNVDMKEVKTITGFTFNTVQLPSYHVNHVEILVSDDGITYNSLGKASNLSSTKLFYSIQLKKSISTRYVQFVLQGNTENARALGEIDIFGK